ncbi:hypothetical protein X727_26575 [Mesorhizobium sp. L103C119B0]|nr:hypothetical protein X765_18415 [Mesorhizobium sp. LSHC440B00]ESX72711.1 hypothetical protein X757_20565 [Mesorhizobium sp. LSHC414A00]ESY12423.1 hypothetical protein X752_05580 [Mesorhizobium sp. LNJC398B00]ESZ56621.1 hypothetical protein X729_23705 [Mesorhizobium sp. L103C131B0]ESZ67367.1 hypothetical protein X727_26575 [Mesorhizobium sp. L103C119B0]
MMRLIRDATNGLAVGMGMVAGQAISGPQDHKSAGEARDARSPDSGW